MEEIWDEPFNPKACDDGPDGTPWWEMLRPIRSLALVNREFAALAQPYLWEFFCLDSSVGDRKADDLDLFEDFVATILPRQGHHIESFTLTQFEATPDGLSGRRTPEQRDWRMRVPPSLRNADTAFIRRRSFLLARAIACMPRLTEVELSFNYLPDVVEYREDQLVDRWRGDLEPAEMQDRREAADAVPMALVALGDRLTDLTLCGRRRDRLQDIGFDTFSEATLASFLSSFPSLSRLFLDFELEPDPEGRNSLLSKLVSLRKLEYLGLRANGFFGDAFATASWTCPLKVLGLFISPPLSPPAFSTFLAHFSSTLTDIELGTGFADEDTFVPAAPFSTTTTMPRVHTLEFATEDPAAFLPSFGSSPIKYLTISRWPPGSEIWEPFVALHAPTLKHVTLQGYAEPPMSRTVANLRTICETNGIEFDSSAD